MLNVKVASKLLDFGTRIGPGARADEQLQGAVAIHNLLESRGVAYLADEVGMGKTYVALGALALMRHFNPNIRVLIVTPRKNIQSKWIKEQRNFVANNVKINDMRVKSLQGTPTRPLVPCDNLIELVREVTTDPNREFYAKMTSFQFPVTGKNQVDRERGDKIREAMLDSVPWLSSKIFDLRSKDAFKDNFAKALCCVLPKFDLVIVDEAHNLKHGFGENVASRNRMLGLAMGHRDIDANPMLFPGFGPRAQRVLFLSATPVEASYRQLWNQLDVFGKGEPFQGLVKKDLDEDPKQRLIVALVQKKVGELLGHERFNSSFQIGMLASFESFLETTKLKQDDGEVANFDDSMQTDDAVEKEGVDVGDINRLARSYRKKFDSELPHPKMDALVESLSQCWDTGEKALVFVRRVASVKELKRKLDDRYNKWLINRLRSELPSRLHEQIDSLFNAFRQERIAAGNSDLDSQGAFSTNHAQAKRPQESDVGGLDTFFAWFFRGDGPKNIVSGATVQRRFTQQGTIFATFFSDNYVADILDCPPVAAKQRLAETLGLDQQALVGTLRERCLRFLSGAAKRLTRGDRFEAVQAAAIELLKEHACKHQEEARVVWHERFEHRVHAKPATNAPAIGDLMAVETFFTKLRERPALKDALWPETKQENPVHAFRERECRANLLSAAARLGHAFIDLYVLTVSRLSTLDQKPDSRTNNEPSEAEDYISAYLNLLDDQRTRPVSQRGWRAFDELSEIASHFDLLVDVNAPDVRRQQLDEVSREFGTLLGRQQPVAGMSGKVNDTVVRQFRMPGYPLVLFSTDLLQEGEDLHTFCSSIHHYGISWTPSAMEQRIGRIDRVRSHSDRRLSMLTDPGEESSEIAGKDKLQVFFPHLEDTVEVFQVHRVLERMNVFLRLMHEGLITPTQDGRTINANHEFAKSRKAPEQIRGRLKTAFPIKPEHLVGNCATLAIEPDRACNAERAFSDFARSGLPNLDILWEPQSAPGVLSGTIRLDHRIQPFTLLLGSTDQFPLVRCISPVGLVDPDYEMHAVLNAARGRRMKVGAVITKDERTYDLTTEGETLLSNHNEVNRARLADLVLRVTLDADRLEQELLPGHDQPISTFKTDLNKEGMRDD